MTPNQILVIIFIAIAWLIIIEKYEIHQLRPFKIKDRLTNHDTMKDLHNILINEFPNTEYFHFDCNIIKLLHSIKEFQQYSDVIYKNIIKLCDKFLKISKYCQNMHKDENIENIQLLYKNLIDIKKKILNELHAFIFNTNHKITQQKIIKSIEIMKIILNTHLKQIRDEYNDKKYEYLDKLHGIHTESYKIKDKIYTELF